MAKLTSAQLARQSRSLFDRHPSWKRFLLPACFLAPFLLMAISFAMHEIHPFGNKQVMVVDFWHQYYPFLKLLQDKLQEGSSLLYTWTSGLGSNFLALASYYCSSPLYLLTILIPDSLLRDFTALFILVKLGLAGLFAGMFLRKYCNTEDGSLVFFSLMYACCAFFMGYYWNIIWLDSAALMPLVVLGILNLIREGKWRLYVGALALCLFSNYYIGLFVCVFSVISYFYFSLNLGVKLKAFLRNSLRFGLCSLMAGGLASVILLPAYYALQLTSSAGSSFGDRKLEWYCEWGEIFSNMLSFTVPTKTEGLPNLACGILCLVLLFVYLTVKTIPLRERIGSVGILAFLLVSCNLNLLYYIWNGFHFTNMIPYRFSFLFSFTLIVMACRAYQQISLRNCAPVQCVGMFAILVVFLGFGMEYLEKDVLLKNLLFGCFFIFILYGYMKGMFNRVTMNGTICAAVILEMVFVTQLSVDTVGTTTYSAYPKCEEAYDTLLQSIESSEPDNSFYRVEIAKRNTLNDAPLYDFQGVSQFSSMANSGVSIWMQRMGLSATEASNRYTYYASTPFMNMLLNVKYVLAHNSYMADDELYTKLASAASYDHNPDGTVKLDSDGNKKISSTASSYQFHYDLPLGFMIPDQQLDIEDYSTTNPFENQNQIASLMSGIEDELFSIVDIVHVGHKNVKVTRNDIGYYRYEVTEDGDGDPFLKFNYQVPEDGLYYCYFKGSKIESVSVRQGDETIRTCELGNKPWIFGCGSYEAEEIFTVCSTLEDDATAANFRIYVYQLNEDVLEQIYEALSAQPLEISEYTERSITGSVTAKNDGLLYTSIPWEEGWTVKVDGEAVTPEAYGNAFLAIPVTAGSHTVELRYFPKGLELGIGLCGGTALLILLLHLFGKQVWKTAPEDLLGDQPIFLRRRKRAKKAEPEAESMQPEPEIPEPQEPTDENA